nr:uncharacterized protein LOC112723945 [Arachis hypogaea]
MRQRRWMELLIDYDFKLNYHPEKANVVTDALSQKLLYASWMMLREEELLRAFGSLKVGLKEVSGTLCLSRLQISSNFRSELLMAHQHDDVLPKNDVAEYDSKWLTCQKVKIEHQGPSGTLQPLEILQLKWESIVMDFVSGLPRT